MKTSDLCKAVPVAALLLAMNVPSALAGATNRGENTSATPGEKATTTEEVTSPEHDRRKGTTQTDEMDTPTSPDDVDSSGSSGSSGSGNSGSSNNQY